MVGEVEEVELAMGGDGEGAAVVAVDLLLEAIVVEDD